MKDKCCGFFMIADPRVSLATENVRAQSLPCLRSLEGGDSQLTIAYCLIFHEQDLYKHFFPDRDHNGL
jgi:hypothetical protein